MKYHVALLLYFTRFYANCNEKSTDATVTRINSGEIRGVKVDKLGYAFLNIPYAGAPVREHRFKRAPEVKNWSSIRDCTAFGPKCVQFGAAIVRDEPDESEDCLTLNVFTTKDYSNQRSTKLPVLFYIHGGAYFMGSAQDFHTKAMMNSQFLKSGVVIVTVQYRLGPLGLANNQNAALGDLLMALEWVQENVHNFGGNKDRVTIGGHSSGAIYASIISQMPETNHLYSKLLLMSGSYYHGALRYFNNSRSETLTNRLATIAECENPSNEHMMNCLQSIDVNTIRDAMKRVNEESMDGLTIKHVFQPEIDHSAPLVKSTKPTMMGTTSDEAVLFLPHTPELTYASFKSNLGLLFPEWKYQNAALLRRLAMHHYIHTLGDKKNDSFLMRQYIHMISDYNYYYPAHREATERTKLGGNVYVYDFDYASGESVLEHLPEGYREKPYHGYCLSFLFGRPIIPGGLVAKSWTMSEEETELSAEYAKEIAAFVKTGRPTNQRWSSYGESATYARIDLNSQEFAKSNYHKHGVTFWHSLLPDIERIQLISHYVQRAAEGEEEVNDEDEEYEREEYPGYTQKGPSSHGDEL